MAKGSERLSMLYLLLWLLCQSVKRGLAHETTHFYKHLAS